MIFAVILSNMAFPLSVSNLFNVKGRVAVVTGGSSGLGLMVSKVSSIDSTHSPTDSTNPPRA